MARSIPTLRPSQVAWMVTFASVLSGDPATYGITAGEAATIQGAVDTASNSFTLYGSTDRHANTPAERTSPNTATLTNDIAAALVLCRQYAVAIRNNNGIDDSDKLAAGVLPVNNTRTPIVVPVSSPDVVFQGQLAGVMRFKFADTGSPDSPAKPFGAVGLQVFVAVGAAPTNDPADASYYQTYSANARGRTNDGTLIAFDVADNGKVATVFARWIGKRGDVGPWSLPSSSTIAF